MHLWGFPLAPIHDDVAFLIITSEFTPDTNDPIYWECHMKVLEEHQMNL